VNILFESLNCYFSCIAASSTNFVLFGLLLGAIVIGGIFLVTKKSNHMFFSQIISTFAMIEGFRQMSCPMSAYIWLYFGLISGAMVSMGVVQVVFDRRIQEIRIRDAQFMKKLSSDLGCEIYLLDTQKIKAFTHKRQIYLSVGLVELLNPEEIQAVAAHELYHVLHTPNRLMANTLALTSLWFKSYRDDAHADSFAAKIAGKNHLISAFKKLKVVGQSKRIRKLAT
jgi:heat shock protein HtpX